MDEGSNIASAGPSVDKLSNLTGFEVAAITDDLRREYDIERGTEGVLVTDIDQNRSAWGDGLRKGDVITSVNRKPIRNLTDYRNLMDGVEEGEYILLRIVRNNTGFYVPLRIGK